MSGNVLLDEIQAANACMSPPSGVYVFKNSFLGHSVGSLVGEDAIAKDTVLGTVLAVEDIGVVSRGIADFLNGLLELLAP